MTFRRLSHQQSGCVLAIFTLVAHLACATDSFAEQRSSEPAEAGTSRDDENHCGKDDDRTEQGEHWKHQYEQRRRKYEITGVVVTDSSSGKREGVLGVTLTVMSGNKAVRIGGTDKLGRFRLEHLAAGQYIVAPTQDGYTFNPVTTVVTIKSCDARGLKFVRGTPTDSLSPDLLDLLDNEPDQPNSPANTFLPDGESVADFAAANGIPIPPGLSGLSNLTLPSAKSTSTSALARSALPTAGSATDPLTQEKTAITKMLLSAENYACGRQLTPCSTWDYLADPADPVNRPAQSGLTWVHGGKTPEVRTKSDDGCPALTYGMDCSGFLFHVAQAAGISIPAGDSQAQSDSGAWNLPPGWGLQMQRVTDGSIRSGDIVAWADHIGIAKSSNEVISSTGSTGQCARNIIPRRGPRTLTFAQLLKGPPTTVLRMVAPGATTTTVIANPTKLPATGGAVVLTASVAAVTLPPTGTPPPSGTISFIDQHGLTLCPSVKVSGTPQACSATIATLPDVVTATYSGDANYSMSSGSVTVAALAAPQVTLTADPSSVASGGSSTLTWSATSADFCAATGGWTTSTATSGIASTGALTATTSYSITCTGPGGSTSASAIVTVSGGTGVTYIYTGVALEKDPFTFTGNAAIPGAVTGTVTLNAPIPAGYYGQIDGFGSAAGDPNHYYVTGFTLSSAGVGTLSVTCGPANNGCMDVINNISHALINFSNGQFDSWGFQARGSGACPNSLLIALGTPYGDLALNGSCSGDPNHPYNAYGINYTAGTWKLAP